MDDFGDDLFDEFEKPSASSFFVGVQKSDDSQQNSEEKSIKRSLQLSNAEDYNKKRPKNSDKLSVLEEPIIQSLQLSEDEADVLNKKSKNLDKFSAVDLEIAAPRIKICAVESLDGESCIHEVALPFNFDYTSLNRVFTKKPAKVYDFELDPFQKEAVICIENNQTVLVSAHTSAGKTVVAEYAIALSLRDSKRVIYTTPIKALSNQKYREFHEEFGDVGLITGDVTINPSASCLIMTTEILRSMLYRGSEILKEVGWVIFDEIHYMRDKERGYVWEETLILLPDNVRLVFLSATIPNARQFAEWVAHLHNQPCHVVYTEFRPTPLQHYIYPAGGDGLHLIVDENNKFREENFATAMNVLSNVTQPTKNWGQSSKPTANNPENESHCFKLVKMIMERNFAPVIVFSFSKKECENYAMQIAKLDFTSDVEKGLIDKLFENATKVLTEEDRKLPAVLNIVPLIRRGIGIHHGGLLPILKETIEILFGEGLLKVLYATETFAMGLNMPARTVLFTACRKFDGKERRFITSGEYIQMSGRAGRRGLDDKGIVMLIIDEKVSPDTVRNIVQGKPDSLNSAFHLTYNMVLNLMRVEEIDPEYMLERSFFQFQNQAAIPELVEKVKALSAEKTKIKIHNEFDIRSYFLIRQQLEDLAKRYRTFITKPNILIPFCNPGRLIKVKKNDVDFGWGVIVNFKSVSKSKYEGGGLGEVLLNVLLNLKSSVEKSGEEPTPCPSITIGEPEIVNIKHNMVECLSSLRLNSMPSDMKSRDSRMLLYKNVQEVIERCSTDIPLLDPINDMNIKDHEFDKIVEQIEKFEGRLFAHPLNEKEDIDNLYEEYLKKDKIDQELLKFKNELKKAKSLMQMDDLKCRKRILRRMGYCTAGEVIETKGRIACELSSADELLMTELMFNGVFNDLSVPQTVALLSCFVCDEKSNEMPAKTAELAGPLRKMQELARKIAKVCKEAKLDIDEDSYVEGFKPFLMDVCYEWCRGASFYQICQMTDIFEGKY
ncbi:Hypothetical protein CINCED_3A007924 [Cinara cedri]|uniref:Superkiller viralicidic activity 2-like 2 n=1 Tax=Cinara cedri TaxID=506608 RepID=A0A5E4NK38_9HEMI|nr:Hypothetical protein CINCED_3A007924 [Cinara cedri]